MNEVVDRRGPKCVLLLPGLQLLDVEQAVDEFLQPISFRRNRGTVAFDRGGIRPPSSGNALNQQANARDWTLELMGHRGDERGLHSAQRQLAPDDPRSDRNAECEHGDWY